MVNSSPYGILIFEKFIKEMKMKILPWCELFVFVLYDHIVCQCRDIRIFNSQDNVSRVFSTISTSVHVLNIVHTNVTVWVSS